MFILVIRRFPCGIQKQDAMPAMIISKNTALP